MKWLKKIQWISLPLSIAAFVISWLRIDVYMTNDTFVGIMAGFMGACATILVGVQIYNSIDTRNSINKLNESFEERIKRLAMEYHQRLEDIQILENELQKENSELNKRLEQAKEERISNENMMQSYIHRVKGITLEKLQPFTAIILFYQGLDCSLKSKDIKTIHRALEDLETCVERIKNRVHIDTIHSNELDIISPSNLSQYDIYPLIEEKYTTLYNEIIEIKTKALQKKEEQKNE
ncbi:hypothetical protein O6P32_10345 [Phocaeicola sp. KGMB11183]|uniref:Uncharacterized protein n=1 Tax=Phocaeicola acetigenes TaxID=3016083 RepID=A0ABT4PJ63_9BACT|nr:hypothetical protein [Phocaeicola sp. KGMB11183]MCZ8373101.1 hypothetical protein [Phocaeicola sp. KGMB11183]